MLGLHAIGAAPVASGPWWPHPIPDDTIPFVGNSEITLAGEGPVLEMLKDRSVQRAWAVTLDLHFLSDRAP